MSVEKISKPWRRLAVWLCTSMIGLLAGHFFLNEPAEAFAAPIVFGWRQRNAPKPRVRFIDLSNLYKIGQDRVSPNDIGILIRAAAAMDKNHRPAVIGVDLPIFKHSSGSEQGSYDSPTGTEDLLRLIRSLDQTLPVVFGVESFKMNLNLGSVAPGLESRFASSFTYQQNDLAVMAFGDGRRADILPSLGISLAQEAIWLDGNMASSGHAFGPRHLVPPPKEWDQKSVPAPNWMYVDYSVLEHRDQLTVVAGRSLEQGDPVTSASLFTQADLEKLRSDGLPTIWLVAIATVPEAEDIFTYDKEKHWTSNAEPVRRVYQHGAIAHTYLARPLMRVGRPWDIALDLFCGFLGLLALLATDKWLTWFERHELPRAIWKVVLLSTTIATAVLISNRLASIDFFWFGFAGTASYAIIEGLLAPIFESAFGMSDHQQDAGPEAAVGQSPVEIVETQAVDQAL